MSDSKELVVTEQKSASAFSSGNAFETAQRMAKALATSDLVPTQFKGNVANCLIALEIAHRVGASPLAVMQGGNVIHGKWSWSAQYIIGAINSCGRFEPLRFEMTGEGDKKSCVAWTVDKSGQRVEGPAVSIAMAKAEGWWSRKDRNGNETSKWQTMPDLMLRYRAASFFGRLYASDVLFGMPAEDEIKDVSESVAVKDINNKIKERKALAVDVESESDVESSQGGPGPVETP